jgi:uncharacterized YceG family protein
MSPSRRPDSGGSRSAEDRERDRRERERRRARRTGGGSGATGGFDILTSESDPTISRPPDLDWPGDGPTGWQPAVPIERDEFRPRVPIESDDSRRAVPIERDDSRRAVPLERDDSWPAVPIERDDFRRAAGGFDDREAASQAGYAPRPRDEFQLGQPDGAAGDAVDPFHPGVAPGAGDPLDPGWESDTGGPGQPGFAPDVVYGEPPREDRGTPGEDRGTGVRRPDRRAGRAGGREGRPGLAGRLPSVSMPSGRPTLPAGLGAIGERVSGLRGPRPARDPGAAARPRVRARLPAAGRSAASRAGSLRTSLHPRTARRSPVSDSKSSKQTADASRFARGRVGAIAAIVGVIVVLWFLISLFQPLKGSGHGQVDVVIPQGAGTSAIGTLLAKDHVISSAFFFKLRAELSGKRGKLESGRYVLRLGMSYGAALSALTGTEAQPAVTVKVTIPEGFSRVQIAAVAKKAGVVGNYVAASAHSHVLKPTSYGAPASVDSLEGFLFPDTYDMLPGDPVSKLINEQLVAFKQNLAKVDLTAAKRVNLTAYDVVTIASMVEREAEIPRERPLIAAVIYNRLKANMPLGIDATLRYALNDYDMPLTDSQLALNSPYNTRLHRGLPPTPIGNPGLASLEAAAHPAKVSYLYYVVKPGTCGEDAFSTTFAEFEHDSALYNAARNADHGRSPTTCSG